MMSVLLFLEGVMEHSILDILRDMMLFKPETRFYEITGGMDRLPYSFLPQLQEDILFHQRVTKITQQNDRNPILHGYKNFPTIQHDGRPGHHDHSLYRDAIC
jgi:monoamine oxidase